MLKLANISKNNFLFENLSAINPNNGAKNISIRLADELEIPRYSVLSEAGMDDANIQQRL
jgi:hypothetical protein